jgi:hypothetical protein
MSEAVTEYEEALDRLVNNKPKRVPVGTRINNNSVAKEAGRKKGSVRARPGFHDLLQAIKDAAEAQPEQELKEKASERLARVQEDQRRYKKLYEDALSRELSWLAMIVDLQEELQKAQQKPKNVIAIPRAPRRLESHEDNTCA